MMGEILIYLLQSARCFKILEDTKSFDRTSNLTEWNTSSHAFETRRNLSFQATNPHDNFHNRISCCGKQCSFRAESIDRKHLVINYREAEL